MSDVILAVVERPEAAEATLAAARLLAELTGAGRITALAIRTNPLATIMPTEEILSPWDEARIRAAEQARADALRQVYEGWASALPGHIGAEWADVEGQPDGIVADWGRRADHIVLDSPEHAGAVSERWAIHAALFETDRPVLVLPPARPPAPFGRIVAIAWRDDPRTEKAVLAALRWLGRAERVHVLAGARADRSPPRLPPILAEHGVAAALHVLPVTRNRALGEALLAGARDLGADLLVLGAYVHPPLVGLLLGGVTRHVLAHADIPLLMRH